MKADRREYKQSGPALAVGDAAASRQEPAPGPDANADAGSDRDMAGTKAKPIRDRVEADIANKVVDVTQHDWRPVDRPPLAAWQGPRTRLYTYVLVGDVGSLADASADNEDAARSSARRALGLLLKEVQAGQRMMADSDATDILQNLALLQKTNQFCVPALSSALTQVTPEQYDLHLAAEYLGVFKLAFQDEPSIADRLQGLGPFLLATRQPLGEIVTRGAEDALRIDETAPILLLDMTGRHPEAIPVYLAAFKAVVRKEIVGHTEARPLGPGVASTLLKVSDAIPFVAEVFAGTRKSFGIEAPSVP